MARELSKTDRILKLIEEGETDRIPVSFWRHFYEYEDTAEGLADIMLRFHNEMDWDFMKVNPRETYHDEVWGGKYRFYKDGYRKPERLDYPLKSPEDYEKITPVETMKSPPLKEQIDALHYINKGLKGNSFFLMTVFTPVSIIAKMLENHHIFEEHLKSHPELIHKALENITATFEKFLEECLNAGISGLFYATRHWASRDHFTKEQFDEFCRPYDLRLLKIVKDCPFNMLHICKGNIMLKELSDYPVHGFNWDAMDKRNPSLEEGREMIKGIVMGGIDHKTTMVTGSDDDCRKEAKSALRATEGKGWILGGGCTFSPEVPVKNLRALRKWVNG